MTLLAVRNRVLTALAVTILSLSDVRTTQRSCCKVVVPGRRELCSEWKTVGTCMTFLGLSNSALSARRSQNIVIFFFFSDCFVFIAVQYSMFDVVRAEHL